jgi:hypothetical protein
MPMINHMIAAPMAREAVTGARLWMSLVTGCESWKE